MLSIETIPSGFKGTKHTIEKMHDIVLKAKMQPYVKTIARMMSWGCPEKDRGCKARKIFGFLKGSFLYEHDPENIELLASPMRMFQSMNDMANAGMNTGGKLFVGDCLPFDTLLLTDNFDLVRICEISVGNKVFDGSNFVKVINHVDKGVKHCLAISLNNGSTLYCTGEHRLLLKSGGEVRASDINVGSVLFCPETPIPFGTEKRGYDKMYVEGLYIADGWIDGNRFSISGKDGKPKEKQKHRVKDICNSLGIDTSWHERYIRIYDKEWIERLSGCGRFAEEKRCISLNYTEDSIRGLFEGLMADSGAGGGGIRNFGSNGEGRTFSSISYLLVTQVKMIAKMLGVQCHVKKVVNHGGFGKHPIYRLYFRKQAKEVRVISVAENSRNSVFDIETESHRFYLPENDIVVHNCDDASILVSSLAGSLGIPYRFETIKGAANSDEFTHVYAGLMVEGGWHGTDLTVPSSYFGWRPTVPPEKLKVWMEPER